MMMANENNPSSTSSSTMTSIWPSGGGDDGNGDGDSDVLMEGLDDLDLSIDLETLMRILSEDDSEEQLDNLNNDLEKNSTSVMSSAEEFSCNNQLQGAVVPNDGSHWSQSELQNSSHESEEAPPTEDRFQKLSECCSSDNVVPSDPRAVLGSERTLEFPETSGVDHGKVDSVSHADSPRRAGSLSLTDWSTVSCVEHDTCSSRERDGASMDASLYNYDRSTIPTQIPSCNNTFNFASGESSGSTDHVNLIDLNNENENDFMHAGDFYSKCSPHFTVMDESDLTTGNCMEQLGGLKRNYYTYTSEISVRDAEASVPNAYPTEIYQNQVSDLFCEDDNVHTRQSSCEPSRTFVDNSTCTDISEEYLPNCYDLPLIGSKNEQMSYTEGEVEVHYFPSRSMCMNRKMHVKAEEAVSGISVTPKASAMNFSKVGTCQGQRSNFHGSSHCYIGLESSYDADVSSSSDASWRSLPGNQSFMPMKKEMVGIEDDQRDEFHVSSSAFCHSFNADNVVEDYSLSVSRSSVCGIEDRPCADQASNQLIPDTQSLISTKRIKVSVKDEKKNDLFSPRNLNSHHKMLNGVVKGNNSVYRSEYDVDADVCILEDISDPRIVPLVKVNGESLITSQQLVHDPSYHIGMAGTRLRATDERITFRVAMQDLSQPKSESAPPEGTMSVSLLRHQRIALSWMVQKETASVHCSGGILADDQGLGKTISTIALILKEKPPSSKLSQISVKQEEPKAFNLDDDDDGGIFRENGLNGDTNCGHDMVNMSSMKNENALMLAKGRPAAGTLIVCPTSVLRQWNDELQNKVSKETNLSVLVYHGSNRTKDPFELAKYDVVITTYYIVSMEVPKQPLVDKDDEERGQAEGHGLPPIEFSSSKKRKYPPSGDKKPRKNKKGMDNALLESFARPLARVGWFRVVLDEAQSIKNHRTQVARACWGLRAKRRWCLSGTPIQNHIDDLYSYFRFLRFDPYASYKSFCSMIKVPISRSPTHGYKKLQAVLKTIMLRRTKGTLLDGEPIINLPPKSVELKRVDFSMEERDFYSKLEADSRAQFKVYAAAGTVKQNYVNILLMLLRLRQACDHPLLVKGNDSSSVWRSSVETAKKLATEKQMQLLNCMEACSEICGICNDPPEDAVVTICGHVFCNQCILEYLTGDENLCPAVQCKVHLTVTSVFSRDTLRSSLSDQRSHDNSVSKPFEALEPHSQGPSDSSKIKAALEVLESLSKPLGSPLRNSALKPSNEVTLCVANASDSHLPEKAIVFSQWTRMLDLLEVRLKNSSIQYRRLDGTMSVLARDKAVKDFNTVPEVTVMIMSLKAASLGLNMVAACHVILLDLWWNPTTEDQAIDRAHRIGQTRPVSVLRLTVKDTVEDRILALQQKKREMVASAFGEDETGSRQTRLTVDDLKYLFMV
ncbi:Helicase-like transcription factor chr28 [Thalictrum thalictroides]|uniref:Helicase-like transcription factor chr28 n=1 Tax=Thalictrum thalictroides TaxID=46969 RepID=A0A7J6VW11_THATH|nr:Helicase-like transcription factor chr28 [Thalictrum thalictroides]